MSPIIGFIVLVFFCFFWLFCDVFVVFFFICFGVSVRTFEWLRKNMSHCTPHLFMRFS